MGRKSHVEGHVLRDETTVLPVRAGLNFTGAGVVATDNAGSDRTDVTIAGDAVSSVSNADGTLTISPTTGVVVASLAASLLSDVNANTAARHNALTIGTANGLSVAAGQVLSLGAASGAAAGALSSADWTTFNGKESVLTFNSPLSRSVNTISLVTVPLNLGGTNANLTAAAGGLIYSTASALAVQAAGTSGYFARSGGTGAPTWFDLFGTANTFTANQTISNTAPSFILTDTTASAKSLTVAVDANLVQLRESAGAANSLLALDLTNAVVGIRMAPNSAYALSVSGIVRATSTSLTRIQADGDSADLRLLSTNASGKDWRFTSSTDGNFLFQENTAGNILFLTPSKNLGLNTAAIGTSAQGVFGILNAAVVPGSSPANMIQIYATDSSDGAANSTLALRTEQAVEAIGVFVPSNKLKIWINGVEYWIQLDAVL